MPPRFRAELRTRLAGDDAPPLAEGPVLQKSVTPMRSFVAEPMQFGRLPGSSRAMPPLRMRIRRARSLACGQRSGSRRG